MPLRVVAADDNLLIREGIRGLLAGRPAVDLVALAADLDGLLDAVERHAPDVVLTDIRMPPTHTDEGVRAAYALRDSHPDLGVVILSQHLDAEHAFDLLRQGSAGRGYLLKDRLGEPEVLLAALQDVAQGRSCVDSTVVDALVTTPAAGVAPALATLTPRERRILALVAEGASNSAIAQRLVISKGAVEKHLNAMFAKLGLQDDPGSSRRVVAVLIYLRG